MMSAEWLASGTNPVRLSAKGGREAVQTGEDGSGMKEEGRRSVSGRYYPVTSASRRGNARLCRARRPVDEC